MGEEKQIECQTEFDEISIREIIEALLRGKKIIAVITILSLLVTGVVNWYIIKPSYEAKSVVMASYATDRLVNKSIETEGIEDVLQLMSSYPTLTLQTYKEQLVSPEILNYTIDTLDLDMTRTQLKGMIDSEIVSDTNLIRIKVKNTDPELAAKIANTITYKFAVFIEGVSRKNAAKASQSVADQIKLEKEKLDKSLGEFKEFLSQPKGVNELEKELEVKLEELNEYKDNLSKSEVEHKIALVNNETSEKSYLTIISQAKEELKETPEKLTTEKSLGQDSLMTEKALEDSNERFSEVADLKMKEEVINENFLELQKRINDYNINLANVRQERENIIKEYNEKKNILTGKINAVQKEVEELNVSLAERQQQQKLIETKVNLANDTYELFQKKYEELKIAETSEIGENSITIISNAEIPERPVSPNKTMNLAIAGVLGSMVSVFIVFFKEYWIKTGAER